MSDKKNKPTPSGEPRNKWRKMMRNTYSERRLKNLRQKSAYRSLVKNK